MDPGNTEYRTALENIKNHSEQFGRGYNTAAGSVMAHLNRSPSTSSANWPLISSTRLLAIFSPRPLPSLVRGAAITFVTLFGYSAMAGTVGAGGLGDIAIRYGYQRFQTDVMIFAVLLCVVLVIVFQAIGDVTARKIDKRRR